MGLYDRDYGRYNDSPVQFGAGFSSKPAWLIIIVINVVAYLLNAILTRQDQMTVWMMVHPDTLTKPWLWWEWLTYGFAHSPNDISHILFNMFGLFIFGSAIEQRLGRWELTRFYLLAIIVGGITWSLRSAISGGNGGGVLGASGGVQAVTILFCLYYPQATIYLMMVFPVKAWVVGLLFAAGNAAGALMGTGQTAFDVHLAGIVFAAAYYYFRWNFGRMAPASMLDLKDAIKLKRSNLKLHDPDRKLAKESAEADRILQKIHEQGEASLTSAERKLLERYSRRVRDSR
jgi:membrane associated rhomboid family serine protease